MENVAIIFDGLYGGGAERIAGLLSVKLAERYNVFLFLERTDNFVYKYAGTIVDCGVGGYGYMEYNVLCSKKKYNIKYSISFMEYFNYINIKTRQQDKIIISERCNMAHIVPRSSYDNIMVRQLYNCADHIVAISNGVKKDLICEYGVREDKITTIYNFIEQDQIIEKSNLKANANFKSNANKLILNIGRLEEQKDQKRLLYQFKRLYDEDHSYRLVIIGSGSQYANLMELINQLGLTLAVSMLQYMENPFPILKQADIFVLSSKYEGLGNVILEAMCLGIPVISTICPSGPAEILSDRPDINDLQIDSWIKCERGILVTLSENQYTSHLADAINYLFNDDEYRMQIIQNQKEYMAEYSESKIYQQWLDVIFGVQNIRSSESWNSKIRPLKNVIYGAGKCCQRLIKQIRESNRDIYAIAVSDSENKPSKLYDIPIYSISQLVNQKDEINIILGVYNFDVMEEMCKVLEKYGFANVERPILLPI